jgi:hypothetical protein
MFYGRSKCARRKFVPIDVVASPGKIVMQTWRVKTSIILRVHSEEDFAVRLQYPLAQVIQEKPPFFRAPEISALVTVETDGKRGDQIEPFTAIGEGLVGFDLVNNSIESEKLKHFSVHRWIGNIETDARMSEVAGDQQKEAGAATQIQDSKRFSAKIQTQLLSATDVHRHETPNVQVLGPMSSFSRDSVFFPDLFQTS